MNESFDSPWVSKIFLLLQVKESDVNEDDEVDIVTVDKDPFSDSDMSQEELCFLPAIPCPDVPEQQDKCVGSSSKLIDSNHSGSPLSEENGQNGQAANNASSPLEGKFVPLKSITNVLHFFQSSLQGITC